MSFFHHLGIGKRAFICRTGLSTHYCINLYTRYCGILLWYRNGQSNILYTSCPILRRIVCIVESDMDYDDLDYQGNNISLCLSPTPYPDTTTEPSTPTPRNPSLVSSSTTHRSSNDADHGKLRKAIRIQISYSSCYIVHLDI